MPRTLVGENAILSLLRVFDNGTTSVLVSGWANVTHHFTILSFQKADAGTYRCEVIIVSNELLQTPEGIERQLIGLSQDNLPQPIETSKEIL